MWAEEDLRELRRTPDGERADWMARRFPDGVPPQWWRAVEVTLEDGLNPFRDAPPEWRVEEFTFAAEFVRMAVGIAGITPGAGGRWMLGLATVALRFERLGRPLPGLPDIVSPDGAAEWALGRITLTRERAIAEAEARRVWNLGLDESSYVPAGGQVKLTGQEVPFAELLDVEKVLDAFTWVAGHVEREETAREIRAWLEIRESL